MKKIFANHNFSADSAEKIDTINGILDEYSAEGYDLTVRQLYYQLVARDYIENSQRSYKRVVNLVNNARLAGLIDWDMIDDRGRETVTNNHWTNPAHIIKAAAEQFTIDRWEGQTAYVEVMVEKQALEGVLIPVCQELDVRFTANKGYSSSSIMHKVGERFADMAQDGKDLYILYLGDHDPSGIDMTRDVIERATLFADGEYIEINRLALNWNQVEEWNPPKNPAKENDSRFASYAAQFGKSSWELDAVDPKTLAQLVRDAVESVRDEDAWQAALEKEAAMKKELLEFAENYGKKK